MVRTQQTFDSTNFDLSDKRSQLDYLFDSTIRHGGMVSRYYDVTVKEMENQCIYHSKDCRFATLGKSITMYVGKDNSGFRSVCTFHALQDLVIRVTREGYLTHTNTSPHP